MDLHILIVFACVFLASLGSLLFINKFLRRKTFEEIVAEKKALTEKIYGKEKSSIKKPKKQALKKELKREKKQRLREQVTTTEQEDSDVHSEQTSIDDEPHGISKTHVEFEAEPEIVSFNNHTISRRSSTAEKENINKLNKGKKDKKPVTKTGILIHKNDQNIKEASAAEINIALSNNCDMRISKDSIELKKIEKKEEKMQPNKKEKMIKKSDNRQITDKNLNVENNMQPLGEVVIAPVVIKELKQMDEKIRQSSPKNNQQKSKQQNKKQKELKDVVVGFEKLLESDTIGVSLLMNLFRRAELNRSEIQILIDYLLNRQQDMPSSHSEWSDDICQKLKRQLEEKEKALLEEQEASIGIQAKLRELRSEINTERATMNNTIKTYVEKIQTKDQDIALLEQKIKTLNDNLSMERQQFQAKLIHEKQSGSQDLLAQLQIMQNEIGHKDKCIAELTCIVNASRQAVEESQQKNEIIQNQVQQIRTLEQQREELEQVSNNRIFELEKAKQLESEYNDVRVEICNLQNALESARSELDSLKNELALVCNKGIKEKQQEISALQATNAELTQQLMNIANQTQEQTKEHSGLQNTIEKLKKEITEREKQLLEAQTINSQIQEQFSLVETASKQQAAEHTELQKLIESLKNEVSKKTQQLESTEKQAEDQQELKREIKSLREDVQKKGEQLQESLQQIKQQEELDKLINSLKQDVLKKSQQLEDLEKETEKLNSREKELLQQLHEQKEKNNDLRTKNWKLIEALRNAEDKISKQSPNAILVEEEKTVGVSGNPLLVDGVQENNDQKLMKDLLERLCPEAVKACADTALTISFTQWLEQVLTTQFKKQEQHSSRSHKTTQSNSLQCPSAQQENSHSNVHSANGSRSSCSSLSDSPGSESTGLINSEKHVLIKENSILRIRNDEVTKLAGKTENTLSNLMKPAEDQDEHWRNIIHSEDEQIKALQQHSNGQEDI